MTQKENNKKIPGSFRDPAGFLFSHSGKLYRQINRVAKDDYEFLMNSGLYHELTKEKFLIPHEEVPDEEYKSDEAYKIIAPEKISFISYPYEWCFGQLKDAALLILNIQKRALTHNMSLKDASAYNIQFHNSKPIFIDTLSFEKYEEGAPWIAYRQFCQHFLAPLALMKYSHVSLNQLLKIYIDGVPLDVASSLLPLRTRLIFALQAHVHLHAKMQKKYSATPKKIKNNLSKFALTALLESLHNFINKLQIREKGTEWANYYDNTNYSEEGAEHKKKLIAGFLDQISPKTVWDLGANTGMYSQIAARKSIPVISFDIDPEAVEKNYFESKKSNEKFILPLIMDLTNPSPGIGWENEERSALLLRGPADCAFALALIHHLAISNNTPFAKIAEFLSRTAEYLIIEFVPKTDSKVQHLLATRKDIYPHYDEQNFEYEFKKYFQILEKHRIQKSERTLYLMKKNV